MIPDRLRTISVTVVAVLSIARSARASELSDAVRNGDSKTAQRLLAAGAALLPLATATPHHKLSL